MRNPWRCWLAILVLTAILALSITPLSNGSPSATIGDQTTQHLLALLKHCQRVSNGLYKLDQGLVPTVPICQLNGAVFWTADMDIDCDGKPTKACNSTTDPWFQADTAAHTLTGKPLDAERIPYIVIPSESPLFRYSEHDIALGAVVAVIYRGQVQYGVFGDTGPENIIGEASYAFARRLGIDPDPRTGGVDAGVSYIVFQHSRLSPIEDRNTIAAIGKQLTEQLILNNVGRFTDR